MNIDAGLSWFIQLALHLQPPGSASLHPPSCTACPRPADPVVTCSAGTAGSAASARGAAHAAAGREGGGGGVDGGFVRGFLSGWTRMEGSNIGLKKYAKGMSD